MSTRWNEKPQHAEKYTFAEAHGVRGKSVSGKSDPYDVLIDDWKALPDDELLAYFGNVYWGWKMIQHKLDTFDDTEWATQAAYDADQATEESYQLHYTMVQTEIKRRDIGR